MKASNKLKLQITFLLSMALAAYFLAEPYLYFSNESNLVAKVYQIDLNSKTDGETVSEKIKKIPLQSKTVVRYKASDYLSIPDLNERSRIAEKMLSILKEKILEQNKNVVLIYDFLSSQSCADKILFLKNIDCPQNFNEIERFYEFGSEDILNLSKLGGIKSLVVGWDVNIYFFRLKKVPSYSKVENAFWKFFDEIKVKIDSKPISVGLNFDQLKAYNFWSLIDNPAFLKLNFISFSIWLVDRDYGEKNFKQAQMYLLDSVQSPIPVREVEYYRARIPNQKLVLYYDLGNDFSGDDGARLNRRSILEKHIEKKGNLFANPI